jgi:hypothetical protein
MRNIFFTIILLISSLFMIIHSVKFIFTGKDYYYMPTTYNSVIPYLRNGDTLIITAAPLFGPFVNLFDQQFSNNPKINAFYLFPYSIEGPTIKKKNIAYEFLKKTLPELESGHTVWGVSSKEAKLSNNNKYAFITLSAGIKLKISIKDIFFKDERFSFFTHTHVEAVY